MIRLTPIVERLQAGGYPNSDGMLEFAGLAQAPRALPALFVVPQRDRAQPNRLSGVIDQKVVHGFAIVLVLPVAARRPGAVDEALADHIEAICGIMLGWKHPDASGPCEYAGGDLTSVDGQAVAWSIGFTAPYHLRS